MTFNPVIDLGTPKNGTRSTTTLGKLTVSASPTLAEIDRLELSELVRTALTLRA